MVNDRSSGPVGPLVLAFALLALVLALLIRESQDRSEELVVVEVNGPDSILAHRQAFRSAADALAHNDPARAIGLLESFSFVNRAAEPYRLYLLANAYSLAGDHERSRENLERSWTADPSMVVATDIAYHLYGIYSRTNGWSRAAGVSGELAELTDGEIVGAAARRDHLIAGFYAGNPAVVYRSALHLATRDPESDAAEGAIALVTELRGRRSGQGLFANERLLRVEHLLEKRRPVEALELAQRIEENDLSPVEVKRLRLATGQALGRLGRHRESEEALEPFFSEQYRFAIPALEASARNQRVMAATPIPSRISKAERRRREDEKGVHEKRYIERLRDLLSLPIDNELRSIILVRLIDQVESGEDVERLQRLITALTRVDPSTDRGLQLMWDQGWLAYENHNDPIAIDRFDFIARTFRDPAIQRQARYWLARSLQRAGRTERAHEILVALAETPYEDLYGSFARQRLGLTVGRERPQPLPVSTAEEWSQYAEREMPKELRLAWELTLLGEFSAAREEIRKNRSESNQKFADALLAESFHADGAWQIANRYLKRAFPSIMTAAQSDVPLHFLRIYYVLPFESEILEHAAERELDPAFVAALAHQETTFNPNAVSPVGAKGLMQLMPATAREIGEDLYAVYQEDRLFEPGFNIDLGTYYIAQVLKMMDGDVELAAAGYNGGPYRIRRWRRESDKPKDEFIEGMPLSETRNYVKRVTMLRASYRALYPSLRASG